MAAKIHNFASEGHATQVWAFHCPGCGYDHAFTVGPNETPSRPRWSWNGSLESPTFTPSLLCNKDFSEARCHSVVTDGRIAFQNDCFHSLVSQTVDMPDWED